jgi:hypothetical protein
MQIFVAKIDAIKGLSRGIIFEVWLVVSLDIGSKSVLAIFCIVEMFLMKNHSWTMMFGYSLLGWEKIQSLGSLHDLDVGHGFCDLLVGELIECCSDPFLDYTVVVFCFWDMLLRICKVHVDSKVIKHGILEQLKFAVPLIQNLALLYIVIISFKACL